MTVARAPRTGGVRFAPSPTGRFHVGNLRTAWISFAWARALREPWVVRMEDIDRPRVLVNAREQQLADMARLGLVPDVLLTQSDFRARHWELFSAGVARGRIYPCDCSRKEVQEALAGLASAPHAAVPVYSGRCRERGDRSLRAAESLAWRFRMPASDGREDFIVARSGPELGADGLPDSSSFVPAYHWACAIDDWDGRYRLLVRSIDLAPALPLQRAIQKWLAELENEPAGLPAVFHTTLITQNDGHRLEKRTRGVTLPELEARGIGPEALNRIFSASFDAELLRSPPELGAEIAEIRARLSLAELGL